MNDEDGGRLNPFKASPRGGATIDAAMWRVRPPGQSERWTLALAAARISLSGARYWDPCIAVMACTRASIHTCSSASGPAASICMTAAGFGGGRSRSPVVEAIEVRTQDPIRVSDRRCLSNHASQRQAHEMRLPEAQVIKHADRILRHVRQLVGHRDCAARLKALHEGSKVDRARHDRISC